jgi:hypothetical protein
MKILSAAVLCGCILLCNVAASAQTDPPINQPDLNKPKLFNDLPDRIDCNLTNLVKLFDLQLGETATISLTANFSLIGTVVSTANNENAVSVVIRSTNRPGARMTFTKVTNADNTIKYIGRIMSLQHGDTYQIIAENNHYYFQKKGLYDLVNE